PMLEEPLGLGSDLPLVRGEVPPGRDVAAHLVNNGSGVVLLPFSREAFALVEDKLLLGILLLPFFWFGNRSDEFRLTSFLYDPLGRLTLFVKLPMPGRTLVGGVQDRVIKEGIGHAQ